MELKNEALYFTSAFERDIFEETIEVSQFNETPVVVLTLFKPLMYSISKRSRTSLFTEHGDNENTNMSIIMTAL